MHVGRGVLADSALVIATTGLVIMSGMEVTQERKRMLWDKRNPTSRVCMICTAMYGSGVRIILRRYIVMVLLILFALKAPSGCVAAADGSAVPATAGQRVLTTIRRADASDF